MKHRYVIVLAANPSEGATYARRAGLPARTYRVPAAAKSIKGLQAADVHILPSFASRPDRHAILAELRHGRDIVMLDVEMPAYVDPRGPLTERALEVAYRYDRLRDDAQVRTLAAGLLEEFAGNREALLILQGLAEGGLASLEDEIVAPEDVTEPEEAADGSEAGAPEPSEDAAPTPTRRRRSRCADCGELTFEKHDHSDPADTSVFFGPVDPDAAARRHAALVAATTGPDDFFS